MKIRGLKIIIFLLALLSAALFCGCSNFVVINGIRMKDTEVIEIAIGDFSYEGKKIVVEYAGGETREADLTEDMIPEAEKLKFYKVGEHDVKVVYNERYTTSFKLSVHRHEFDDVFQLVGYTVTYDGEPHRVRLNRELPEGASIEYEYGNSFTNVGEYEIAGVISKEGYVSKRLTTTLVIEKADFDESKITMEDKKFTYDGEAKTTEVTGVPEGVEVSYDLYSGDIKVSRAINVGEYRIVAHFDAADSNYNKIPDRSASIIIEKADYDMSGVILEDYTKNYDGAEYVPSLAPNSVLPQGVTASVAVYKDGERVLSNARAGEYDIVASFTGNTVNYNPIPNMTAKLTVLSRTIKISDLVSIDDMTVNYDGQVHSLSLKGELPQGVSVTFENNDQIYAGEYDVVARFAATSANEKVDVEEMHAYLIINQVRGSVQIDGHEISGDDMYYDKETHTLTIMGFDDEVYGIHSFKFYSTEDGSVTEWGSDDFKLDTGKSYNYTISFYYLDEAADKSVRISDATGVYTHHEVELNDKTVTYDGGEHTVEAQYVPRSVNVTYDYYLGGTKIEKAVIVGKYTVIAQFEYDGEPFLSDKIATLTIEKGEIDMSSVLFEDATFEYDGDYHIVQVENLPEGVFVAYETYVGDTKVGFPKEVGEYRFVARFLADYVNYKRIPNREITITIEKRLVEIKDLVKFEDITVDYDGEEHSIYIEGDLPPNVNVSYDNNNVSERGEHEVTANFTLVDPENERLDITELKAKIIIRLVFTGENIKFEDKTVDFEFDKKQYLEIEGELDDFVNVEYDNNGQMYAGAYEVTARFLPADDGVIMNLTELKATLTINKIEADIIIGTKVITSAALKYNPIENSITVMLLDTNLYVYDAIHLSYVENGYTNDLWFRPKCNSSAKINELSSKYAGLIYTYEIMFHYRDENLRNSVTLKVATGKCQYNVSIGIFIEVTEEE